MATTKILGMKVNVEVFSENAPFTGRITKEIFCPNYQYYEDGVTTLDKSAYYSGMFSRTCIGLLGMSSNACTLYVTPVALVFDGEPEITEITITSYRIIHDGSIQTYSSTNTIGDSLFPLINEDTVDISSFELPDTESGSYSSVGCFGYLGFDVKKERTIPLATIGYYQ